MKSDKERERNIRKILNAILTGKLKVGDKVYCTSILRIITL